MKKILISIFAIIFSSIAVLASDTKFAQIDGAFVNASDEQSVKNFETLIDKIKHNCSGTDEVKKIIEMIKNFSWKNH